MKSLNPRAKLEAVAPGDRVESWKEIAAYLNRSERTVRRWEEKEGLPVHRLQHDKRGSVYGFRRELDTWRDSRRQLMEEAPEPRLASSRKSSRSIWWSAAAVVMAAGLASGYWILRRSSASAAAYTPNPEAYVAFRKASFGANAGRAQIQAGIKYYQEAVRLDPRFAKAWAGLATAHLVWPWYGEVPARDMMTQAKAEAQKALALDGSLSGPWRVLAFSNHVLDWDQATAEKQFRKAMELGPADAVAASWFAEFLLDMRRYDDAMRYARRAQEINPRWIESMTVAGNIRTFSGNPELAIAEYQRALELEPSHALTNHFLGRAYLAKGQFAKAIEQLRRSNELLGQATFSMGDLGYAMARGGQRPEAERMLAGLLQKRREAYYPASAIAEIQLGLGNTEAALDWMERAAEERNLGFYLPSADPIYNPIRSHPRFQALMQRIGITP
jgi:serine/threonine-protein kinase